MTKKLIDSFSIGEKLEELVFIFNKCREMNFVVDKIVDEIIKLLLDAAKDIINFDTAIVKDLEEILKKCLLEANELVRCGDFVELKNEKGDLIFCCENTDNLKSGFDVNEFLISEGYNLDPDCEEGSVIVIKNIVCVDNKVYYSSGINGFDEEIDCVEQILSSSDFVCKSYDKNGVVKISYVYPLTDEFDDYYSFGLVSFMDSVKEEKISKSAIVETDEKRELIFKDFIQSQEKISEGVWDNLVEATKLPNVIRISKSSKSRCKYYN